VRKRKSIEERKEEVFIIISQIIAEQGLSEVSTVEVAKRLGVSQPAIYKYFKNKDEMIIYFVEHLKKQLKEIIEKAKEEKTSRDKLKKIYTEHLKLLQKTKILPRVIFSDVIYLGNPQKKEKLKEAILYYKEGITKIFEDGIKKGEIVEIDPNMGARFFIGSIISTTLMWMLNNMNYKMTNDIEKLMDTLDKLFIKK